MVQNLELMFRAVMDAITDPELPVRIQAAIALPEIVRYEDGESSSPRWRCRPLIVLSKVRAGMVPNIGRIMQGS